MNSFFDALILGILLLPGLLLRYMPFRHFLSVRQKRQLACSYGAWFIILFCIEFHFLQTRGLSLVLYKQTMIFAFLPYFVINILLIPHHMAHHLFVVGMQSMYTLLLHTGALLIEILVNLPFTVDRYYVEISLYIILFLITFPFIRNFFDRVFLSPHAINDQAYWRSVCLLPLLIIAGVVYSTYGNQLVVIQQMIPRMLMLPTFIALIYAFSYDMNGLEEKAHLSTSNKFLSMQLQSLKEHAKLLDQSNKKMAIFRHDVRHYNRMLKTLITEGHTDSALHFIKDCDDMIDLTRIEQYALNPVINAALTIYITRAESENIPLSHEINLPADLSVDDNEFAIVICNLLENAFNASYKQPISARGIRLTLKAQNRHIILSVANRFQETVPLGEDNLPVTKAQGHGIGMRSLKAFKEKYGATIMCDQTDGIFKIMLYVADSQPQ